MSFSATVNLGTVGVSITSVKLWACTGSTCSTGTTITGYENVSVTSFPLLVSGIPNGSRYIKVEALGDCSNDAVIQCISISGIPGATPAPTSTLTPTPSATTGGSGATPTPTSTPTPTPTGTSSCVAPTLNSVTLVGGSTFTLNYTTPPVNCTALTLSRSRNQVTWTDSTGGCTTGRQLDTLDATGTWYFRLTQICGGVTSNSNIVSYTYSTPAPTPTPSATALPGCSSTVSGTFTGSTMNNYDDIQLSFAGVANGSIINFTCSANDRPNNISIRTGTSVIESTGWFGNSSGYNSEDYWYPTEGTGPITLSIIYDNTKTYYIDVLTAPALAAPNEVNDNWEVSIQCLGLPATPTPSATTPPLYGFFRSNPKSVSNGHCNDNQVTSAQFWSTSNTITGMLNTTVYTDTSYTAWQGGDFYYAVSTDDTFNTNTQPYQVLLIDNTGNVTSVMSITNCSGPGNTV